MIFFCMESATTVKIHHFPQKSIFSMAAALCQALPSFYSDYKISLFISVSNKFYEICIVNQGYCVSTHNFSAP